MASTNSTLHLQTAIPNPMVTEMSTTAMDSEGHIPLPSPILLSEYIVTCVILLVVSTLAVGIKFTLTWKGRRRFGKDDAMIGAGLLTLIATGVMGGEAYRHGLGKPAPLANGQYTAWKGFWWEYLFYTVWYTPLCFSKLAFFCMYTRTFHGKKMKRTLWTSMFIFTALTILFITGTSLMSAGIEQSRGPEAIKALRYHLQFRYLHYAWGTCDILADLWICILPLAGLKVLRVGLKKRLSLTLKFAITFVVSMIRIYELNLVMSRDIMKDHTWDPALAETVPLLWAVIQASAAVIITTLPSLALRLSIWYKKKSAASRSPSPVTPVPPPMPELDSTEITDISKAECGEAATPLTSSAHTTISLPTQGSTLGSTLSKTEKLVALGQRLKRSRTPDEYSEDAAYHLDPISGITVTRTVNVTSTLDPEEGFKVMYRKYCGVA